MLTLSLGGNMKNWLSQVNFNGLDRSTFRSMDGIQYAIVIYVKNKRGNVAMEGNKRIKLGEISTVQHESYRMDGQELNPLQKIQD